MRKVTLKFQTGYNVLFQASKKKNLRAKFGEDEKSLFALFNLPFVKQENRARWRRRGRGREIDDGFFFFLLENNGRKKSPLLSGVAKRKKNFLKKKR